MFLPLAIAFAGLMTLIGFNVGRGKADPLKIKGASVGAAAPPGFAWNPYTNMWERDRRLPKNFGTPEQQANSPLMILTRIISSGGYPTPALLNAAFNEATATHDYQSAQLIEQLAMSGMPGSQVPPPQVPYPPVNTGPFPPGWIPPANARSPFVGEEGAPSGEIVPNLETFDVVDLRFDEQGNPILDDYEVANPESARLPMVPPPDIQAPQDAWAKFCEALRTKKPAWSSEQYLGCFEHNRHRLKQLGLSPEPGDEAGQYQALCEDLTQYTRECEKLIRDFTGDTVDVDGHLVPVSRSGILGLLKAAGPRGAESWLRNKRDRLKFPQTTDTFRRTNGCF